MIPGTDYSLIERTPDGTGKILVTVPGIPNVGAYVTEQKLRDWVVEGLDGLVWKGTVATASDLPTAAGHNGWMYYETDIATFVVSNGSTWESIDTFVVQTPDATDTGHALSNAAATTQHNNLKNAFEALGLSVVNGAINITYTA